jgi:hypothetical protein
MTRRTQALPCNDRADKSPHVYMPGTTLSYCVNLQKCLWANVDCWIFLLCQILNYLSKMWCWMDLIMPFYDILSAFFVDLLNSLIMWNNRDILSKCGNDLSKLFLIMYNRSDILSLFGLERGINFFKNGDQILLSCCKYTLIYL